MRRLLPVLFALVIVARVAGACTDSPTPTDTATPTPVATPAPGPYLKVSQTGWLQNVSGHKWAKYFTAINETGEDIPFSGSVQGANANLFSWVAGSSNCGPILPAMKGCPYWIYSDTDGATGFDVLTTDVDDPASPYSIPLLVP